jgi:hypothetical protein
MVEKRCVILLKTKKEIIEFMNRRRYYSVLVNSSEFVVSASD